MKSITTELKGTFGTGQAQVLESLVLNTQHYEPLLNRDSQSAAIIRDGMSIKGYRIDYYQRNTYIGTGFYNLKGKGVRLFPNEKWRDILPGFFERTGWKEGFRVPEPEETYPLAEDYQDAA